MYTYRPFPAADARRLSKKKSKRVASVIFDDKYKKKKRNWKGGVHSFEKCLEGKAGKTTGLYKYMRGLSESQLFSR